jgi:hypothetical protein
MEIQLPPTHGDLYQELVTKLTTENQLVEAGLVEMVPTTNTADEYVYIIRDAEGLDQDYTPTPGAASGTISYDSKPIKLGKTMLYYDKIRPQEWENVFRKYQPTGPLVLENLNPLIMKDMFLAFSEQYKEVSNDNIINAVQTAVPGLSDKRRYDGIMTIADASTEVEKVAYSAVTTPAQAQAMLEKLRKGAGVRVRRQANFKYVVSPNVMDLYFDSQYAQAQKGADQTNDGVPRFKGREVHVSDQLGDSEGFAAVLSTKADSNLIMVVAGVASDTAFDMNKLANNSEYYFVKMVWKQGLAIKKHKEFVAHIDPTRTPTVTPAPSV